MKAILADPIITATLNHVEGAKAELDGTHRNPRLRLPASLVCALVGFRYSGARIHRILWDSRHRKSASSYRTTVCSDRVSTSFHLTLVLCKTDYMVFLREFPLLGIRARGAEEALSEILGRYEEVHVSDHRCDSFRSFL